MHEQVCKTSQCLNHTILYHNIFLITLLVCFFSVHTSACVIFFMFIFIKNWEMTRLSFFKTLSKIRFVQDTPDNLIVTSTKLLEYISIYSSSTKLWLILQSLTAATAKLLLAAEMKTCMVAKTCMQARTKYELPNYTLMI